MKFCSLRHTKSDFAAIVAIQLIQQFFANSKGDYYEIICGAGNKSPLGNTIVDKKVSKILDDHSITFKQIKDRIIVTNLELKRRRKRSKTN